MQAERVLLNISIHDVLTLYKLCVDETALHLRPSYWCQLLSPTHLATLHHYHDYKTFWKKGTLSYRHLHYLAMLAYITTGEGQPITALRSVHLVKDIVDFFMISGDKGTKVAFRQVFISHHQLLYIYSFDSIVDLVIQKHFYHF